MGLETEKEIHISADHRIERAYTERMENDFILLHKGYLYDKTLSLREKGLLTFLLSLDLSAPEWTFGEIANILDIELEELTILMNILRIKGYVTYQFSDSFQVVKNMYLFFHNYKT